MRQVRRLVMPAVAVAASACLSSEPPADLDTDGEGGFRTSQPHYEVATVADTLQVEIPYTYRNVSRDTVYFINCNGIIAPSLEKQTGDGWTPVWLGATPACLSPPVAVPPGQAFADTVRVLSWPDMFPQLQVAEIEGRYRLVWYGVVNFHSLDVPQFGKALSQDERTSNEFTLTESPG